MGEPDPYEHEPDPYEHEPDPKEHEPDQDELEPAEFDPESLGPDPPEPPADPAEADPQTARLFWGLVAVGNAALLSLSLGLMFVGFQGRVRLGGALVAAGLILTVYVAYRVRSFQSE
ncbi:hypothetical protein GJ629_04195 [Halapricum sp. CBA1109]|uniref:DUF7322 domain-containing protein n=1 Tax=Halapricum sp. CBA1109 TaxID=2668068 RepID=UPI0012FA0436|nr:hypothetical protein [Halapricum sp. CBA1109]MUV89196.1 hypothetical protein [Halapricum sp. CBA1109]